MMTTELPEVRASRVCLFLVMLDLRCVFLAGGLELADPVRSLLIAVVPALIDFPTVRQYQSRPVHFLAF